MPLQACSALLNPHRSILTDHRTLFQVGADAILEQLEREGSWGKYQLVRPSGNRREALARWTNRTILVPVRKE